MRFTSIYFYYFLIILIIILLSYNIYNIATNFNLLVLIPIIVQLIMLTMILLKNKGVKIMLKIWSLVFFIIAGAMQFIGKLLKDASNDYQTFDFKNYIFCVSILIIGIVIYFFTNKTIQSPLEQVADL